MNSTLKSNTNHLKIIEIPRDGLGIECNFYSDSETVAKFMVAKLISWAVSDSFVFHVKSRLPEECFDFTKSCLTTYLKSQFITFDKEEEPSMSDLEKNEHLPNFSFDTIKRKSINETADNIQSQKQTELMSNEMQPQQITKKVTITRDNDRILDLNSIFFNNYYRGDNKWNMINEPNSNAIDRYASSMINYTKPELDGAMSKNVLIRNDEAVIEPAAKEVGEITGNKNSPIRKKSSILINVNKIEKAEEQIKRKKNKMEIMNEFSSYDIPVNGEWAGDVNVSHIDDLRREREEQLKVKEAEIIVKVQKQKETEIKIKEEVKKKQEFTRKKVTTDIKGNIVLIKGIKIESLAQEFLSIKANLTIGNKKRGSIFSDENNVTNNIISYNTKSDTKLIKDPVNSITNRKKKQLPKLELNQKKSKSQMPKEIRKEAKVNIIPIISSQLNSDFDKGKNLSTLQLLERKKDRGPFLPCGSCFDTISLETGVNITEETKHKSGGKDYYKRYNKYSIDTYNSQWEKSKLNLVINNPMFRSQHRIMSSTDYNMKFIDISSSNVNSGNNTVTQLYTNRNKFNMTSHSFGKKALFNKSNLNQSIKWGSNNLGSFRSKLEGLDLINEHDEKGGKAEKRINIFKTTKNGEINSYRTWDSDRDGKLFSERNELGEINKFTKALLNSTNSDKGFFRNATQEYLGLKVFKPQLKEYEREMGKNIVKVKLPRNRALLWGGTKQKFYASSGDFGLKKRNNIKKGKEKK